MKPESKEGSIESGNGYGTPSRKTVLKERSSNQRSTKTASNKNEYARESYTSITKELRKVLYFMDDTNVEKLSIPDKLAAAVHYIAFLESALMKLEPESDGAQECLLLMDLFGKTPSETVTEDEPNNSEVGHDAKFKGPFELQTLASETYDNPTVQHTTLGANEPIYSIYCRDDITKRKTKNVPRLNYAKQLSLRTKEELVNKSFHGLHAEIWKTLHSRATEIFKNLETLQNNNAFPCEQPNVVDDVSLNASTMPSHSLPDFTISYTTNTIGTLTSNSSASDARLLLSLRRPVHFSPSRPQLPY